MLRVAIHQPNYFPWLGYFAKLAAADVFVLLDDVQFPKHSYTNRVRIRGGESGRWMTIPVSVSLGQRINEVVPAQSSWIERHLSLLKNTYKAAPCFKDTYGQIQSCMGQLAQGVSVAESNECLLRAIALSLGFRARIVKASDLEVAGNGDDRLIELVRRLDPGGEYVSGAGAAKYQEPAKFAAAGLGFSYLAFEHPEYAQIPAGLSVLDAIFELGFERVSRLLQWRP